MKVFTKNRMTDKHMEGRPNILPHQNHEVGRPIPPHERKGMIHIEFGEEDLALLNIVFGDTDTAQAAAWIIHDAPPEIQILAIQLMKMNGSASFHSANSSSDYQVKFPSPAMDEAAQELYAELYGEVGAGFVGILNTSPDEIAVISRLIAHLDQKTKEVS